MDDKLLPKDQAEALKSIQDRQAQLTAEFNLLEQAKITVTLRAALELGLTPEEFDNTDLTAAAGGFVFKQKEVPQLKEVPKEE